MKKMIKSEEYKLIKKQLGRKPDNLLEVKKRCPFDYPAVLLVAPYKNSIVFPTIYWLSCPYLVKEISKIEDKGMVKELTERLNNDNNFREKLKRAHQRYAKERLEYLDQDLEDISAGIRDVLVNSGVGGIIDKKGIKCLHTHVADYLVNAKNIVGELVFNKIKWPKSCRRCEKLMEKE
ncbi:MAG: DUF501 domain-containing protein [Bacillota bacterium]